VVVVVVVAAAGKAAWRQVSPGVQRWWRRRRRDVAEDIELGEGAGPITRQDIAEGVRVGAVVALTETGVGVRRRAAGTGREPPVWGVISPVASSVSIRGKSLSGFSIWTTIVRILRRS
jgi:hypothetical protein